MKKEEEQAHADALSFYSLMHPDKDFFIHQLVVDAYTAQRADAATKPIAIIFALVGLHLVVEKGYSGRAVQNTHMAMARNKKPWPTIELPENRGSITVADVMAKAPGKSRDQMIMDWCKEVWNAYESQREKVLASLTGST